jgi:hypothetical protein
MGKMNMDLYHPNSKVVFGWTYKAGCTVVIKMFLDQCGLLEKALAYSNWVHNFRWSVLEQEQCPPDKRFLRIKFVRNPYSRAVSSYFAVAYQRDLFGMFDSMEHFSFETFLQYLASGTAKWDGHFDKQFYKGEKYHEIIHLEKMDEEIPRLNQMYGLQLKWKFTSSHHFPKKPTMETDYQGKNDFSKNREPVGSYKAFYNEENRKLVESIYGDDILHYGYTYQDFLNDDNV